jgi:ATP-binding cassette subfamily F protein uup
MASPPLIALRDVRLTFGGKPLFEGVTTWVGEGDKTCLIGRNGSGKSTLLKVLAGEIEADAGERFVQSGVKSAVLAQDPVMFGPSVADWVALGLPETESDQRFRVDALLDGLKLDGKRNPAELSGGEARRAALARTLVSEPDVLLLDEPTNHLDLPTILWLEEWLAAFKGALVTISHDRRFLENISRQTLWLERGVVRRFEKGFAHFPAWQEEIFAAEESELARMDTKFRQEMHWLARGVTARRKRNMGRLRALQDFRIERRECIGASREAGKQVKFEAQAGESSGRLVVEAENLTKSYGERVIINDFSTRILRGDRVGFIGPNGAGKTTLLRMLTGDLPPDGGSLKLGTNLSLAYFDQKRAALDPEQSVRDALTGGGSDNVLVQGKPRHIMSYLRDFLFADVQAQTPVKALSGGERNRLLLAKLLAQPSNLLILDEPTNDLDMDTLDLLEEMLADYEGTLLIVSHDRDFLNRLVTSVIAVEGEGEVAEYVGGYDDYLRQRPETKSETVRTKSTPAQGKASISRIRLSYKENRELEQLPDRIDALSAEIDKLEADLADPGLYAKDTARFANIASRLDETRALLDQAEVRWLELEAKREEGKG